VRDSLFVAISTYSWLSRLTQLMQDIVSWGKDPGMCLLVRHAADRLGRGMTKDPSSALPRSRLWRSILLGQIDQA
jgi:hypothetical protein